MQRNVVETVIGAVVLAIASLFMIFAYQTTDLRAVEGYELKARFSRIDGLEAGSDVRISGVKVGTVLDFSLDKEYFMADVRFSVDPSIKLSTDTFAMISSEGLLGGRYLSLEPGGEDELLKDGDVITHTQPPQNLEELIGKFIFSERGATE